MTTTGSQRSVPIVLAIQNDVLRERLVDIVQQIGYHLELAGKPDIVHQLSPDQFARSWVIIDTDDDVASLVQLVNDYHRNPFHIGGETPIICMVSEQAFATNLRLGVWLIGGSAAVFAVWMREAVGGVAEQPLGTLRGRPRLYEASSDTNARQRRGSPLLWSLRGSNAT